jgi:hypothetical protein
MSSRPYQNMDDSSSSFNFYHLLFKVSQLTGSLALFFFLSTRAVGYGDRNSTLSFEDGGPFHLQTDWPSSMEPFDWATWALLLTEGLSSIVASSVYASKSEKTENSICNKDAIIKNLTITFGILSGICILVNNVLYLSIRNTQERSYSSPIILATGIALGKARDFVTINPEFGGFLKKQTKIISVFGQEMTEKVSSSSENSHWILKISQIFEMLTLVLAIVIYDYGDHDICTQEVAESIITVAAFFMFFMHVIGASFYLRSHYGSCISMPSSESSEKESCCSKLRDTPAAGNVGWTYLSVAATDLLSGILLLLSITRDSSTFPEFALIVFAFGLANSKIRDSFTVDPRFSGSTTHSTVYVPIANGEHSTYGEVTVSIGDSILKFEESRESPTLRVS